MPPLRTPTEDFHKLSLEVMPPATRSRGQMPSQGAGPSRIPHRDIGEEGDGGDVIWSPSQLKYNVANVSGETRELVETVFDEFGAEDSPQISLEFCRIREVDGEPASYAFQLHEVRPVRVGIFPRNSTHHANPMCECPEALTGQGQTCKHIILLLDRITKQVLFDHDPDQELSLTEQGYAAELDDPFARISEMRLDVLADALHCDTRPEGEGVVDPDSLPEARPEPSPRRFKEAREILGAMADIEPSQLREWRPDLETAYDANNLVHRGDLEATVFSLLVTSHRFCAWIRSQLTEADPPTDPFLSIHERVTSILSELRDYTVSLTDPAVAAQRQERGKDVEPPCDVPWAAQQIERCVTQIKRLIPMHAVTPAGRTSAARALMRILRDVVSYNMTDDPENTPDELYQYLIGTRDNGFVWTALKMLVDQSQFLSDLESIMRTIAAYGCPDSYAEKMQVLIGKMHSRPFGTIVSSGSSSSSGGDDGDGSHRRRGTGSRGAASRGAQAGRSSRTLAPAPLAGSSRTAGPASASASASGSQSFQPPPPPPSPRRAGRGSRAPRGTRGRGAASGSGSGSGSAGVKRSGLSGPDRDSKRAR